MKGEESGFNSGLDLRGVKIAQCISAADPKGLKRVLVRVIGVHDLTLPDESDTLVNTSYGIWANCCSSTKKGGDIPEIGDYIYVIFPNEQDPMHCLWIGFVVSAYQGVDFVPGVSPLNLNFTRA